MMAIEQAILEPILRLASPLKVVLFGSRARGDFDRESDYDVLVVVPDHIDSHALKPVLQAALSHLPAPVQLLLRRWSDYAATQCLTVGLWHNIRTDGITLYEHSNLPHPSLTMKTNQDLARTLLQKAKVDLKAAVILSQHLTEVESIGFHCQQAVEKALKAVLAYHNIHFPRTHDLGELLKLLIAHRIEYDPTLNDCTQLSDFAAELRYDTVESALDLPTALMLAQRAVQFAESIITL